MHLATFSLIFSSRKVALWAFAVLFFSLISSPGNSSFQQEAFRRFLQRKIHNKQHNLRTKTVRQPLFSPYSFIPGGYEPNTCCTSPIVSELPPSCVLFVEFWQSCSCSFFCSARTQADQTRENVETVQTGGVTALG